MRIAWWPPNGWWLSWTPAELLSFLYNALEIPDPGGLPARPLSRESSRACTGNRRQHGRGGLLVGKQRGRERLRVVLLPRRVFLLQRRWRRWRRRCFRGATGRRRFPGVRPG